MKAAKQYTDVFSLAGQRAVITGASSGIGRAIAVGVAAAGAYVALVSRSTQHLEETKRMIGEQGGRSEVVATDLSSPEDAAHVAARAESVLGGPIDLVVHSAGTQHREPAVTFPLGAWDRIIQVNLTAPFLLSQAIGKQQIARRREGNHIFVASLTSILGLPNLVAYNAAKSGLMGIVRALSREWADKGIRVNGISPGYVETAMTSDLLAAPGRREELVSRIPAGRLGTPDELAAPTVFLASRGSSYMTGQLLIIDGGWAAA